MSDELGPRPEPHVQDPELYPGGTDAVPGQDRYQHDPDHPAARDLDPDDNPAVEDALPDDIAAPDEKTQEPREDEDESDEDANPSEPPG